MEKNELLKILIAERDYHATHPAEVNNKFIYSLGATLTTIIAGFIFKDKIENLDQIINSCFFPFIIILIVAGYCLIFFAIAEHSKFHKLQLNRLEEAIEYIIKPNKLFSLDTFWELYGEKLNSKKRNYTVKLIAKEPDTRSGLRFHDRKIELGIYLILIGVIPLIYLLIKGSI